MIKAMNVLHFNQEMSRMSSRMQIAMEMKSMAIVLVMLGAKTFY
jgi:hypothetical protein